MTSWASGYMTDIAYTSAFFRELSPSFLRFAALAGAGVAGPDPERKLTYCELGCGQGFSANVVAAANPHIEVHAMDFIPGHIAGARALALEAGLSNVHFYEESFEDFLHRADLPAFDIIVLHGVFSWVSPEHRAQTIEILRGKLATGGLVYVSYNAMPGAGALVPLRRILFDHVERGPGPLLARIERALEFAEGVRQAGAAVFAANPALGAKLDMIKSQSRAYVAHEYLNREWHCLYHSDVVDELAEVKLDYVGSANLAARLDSMKLSPEQMALLSSIEDSRLRETVRDSILNTEYRKDIFMRGVTPLPALMRTDLSLDTRFILAVPRQKVLKGVTTNLGAINFDQRVYEPMADALAQGPCTLRELLRRPQLRGIDANDVRQAAYALLTFGQIEPCLSAARDAQRAKSTKAYNTAVMKRAAYSGDLMGLASPVTGGGVPMDRFSQLLLSAWQRKEPDIAAAVWAVLKPEGVLPSKEGRRLETDAEVLAEFAQQTEQFVLKTIPVLQLLGVA